MGRATLLPCGLGSITKWEEAALGGCGDLCEPSYGAGTRLKDLGVYRERPGARLPLISWAWHRAEIGK